ncbi:uncharacterized protein C8Q71DRAFT_858777 [Rhodofomes roseus]|uniref:Uncharacterized protein n=1 Tax=Rhodofomes roseus TaxID=34475 RepID=A0ABQ8KBX3_9APHY|nr:uncharacterized protein C8Q71DRAFT_858777 [Rhodofomes roseus]KAH9835111.1 hypothetical protein C8Q71DRAFT_858777 [Rhodofomes roseus]
MPLPRQALPDSHHGFIPYAYHPDVDMHSRPDEDGLIFDPTYGECRAWWTNLSWRGVLNVTVTLSLLALFISYPIISHHNNVLTHIATADTHINTTGQYDFSFHCPFISAASLLI